MTRRKGEITRSDLKRKWSLFADLSVKGGTSAGAGMDIACEMTPISLGKSSLGAAFVGGLLCFAMTPNDFRLLALSQPQAVEVFRKGRSDFRVWRKSFASLKGPADSVATVQLTPEQQAMFMHAAPGTFVPVPGGWGRLGATNVVLQRAEEATVKSALIHAWRNVAPKALLESTDEP